MRISYGSQDREDNKQLVRQANTFIHEFLTYIQPGRLLVDVLPILKHVPSWLPGAGWKHALREIADMKESVTREPFERSKERIVCWSWAKWDTNINVSLRRGLGSRTTALPISQPS